MRELGVIFLLSSVLLSGGTASAALDLSAVGCGGFAALFAKSSRTSFASLTEPHRAAIAGITGGESVLQLFDGARRGDTRVISMEHIEGRERIVEFLRRWDASRHPEALAARKKLAQENRREAERFRQDRENERQRSWGIWYGFTGWLGAFGSVLAGAQDVSTIMATAAVTIAVAGTGGRMIAAKLAERDMQKAHRAALLPNESALGDDAIGRLYETVRAGTVPAIAFDWTGRQSFTTPGAPAAKPVSVGLAIGEGPNGPFLFLVGTEPAQADRD